MLWAFIFHDFPQLIESWLLKIFALQILSFLSFSDITVLFLTCWFFSVCFGSSCSSTCCSNINVQDFFLGLTFLNLYLHVWALTSSTSYVLVTYNPDVFPKLQTCISTCLLEVSPWLIHDTVNFAHSELHWIYSSSHLTPHFILSVLLHIQSFSPDCSYFPSLCSVSADLHITDFCLH